MTALRPSALAGALVLAGALALAAGCTGGPPPGPQGDPDALATLAAARAAHGSDALEGRTVSFRFRGTPYTAWHRGGQFRYARTLDEGGRRVVETLDNDGPARTVDGEPAALTPDVGAALAESINSVVYFALLPHALDAPALRARALAPDTVGGAPYRRVEVTFAQEGGGADWQDRYVYWVGEADTIDYLAYSYAVAPGDTARAATGSRFREVIGAAEVAGVRFQDYRNLTADSVGTEIERYGALLDQGRTFTVSEVRTEAPAIE